MVTPFRKLLLVSVSFIVLHSASAFGALADFAGIWETQSGWADEYAGWGGLNYTDCAIYAELKANEEYFSIRDVLVKCTHASGRILKQSMPPQDFRLDENGNLTGPTGSGRMVGNQIQLVLPDAYDGTHYVRAEVRGDSLTFDWSYEGEEGSNFEIGGGTKGLTRTEKP